MELIYQSDGWIVNVHVGKFMCGICGVASQIPNEDPKIVGRMQEYLAHRGPDGAGAFFSDHVHLAMRRLSIIDLTGGNQPLYNENRSLMLVANGEIYNYVELRQTLETKGHRFHSKGDCETILHLYEDYGVGCVKYLRGMFAFALWDSVRNKLLLARDRMGEKPLYIFQNKDRLLFSSELKSLLQSGQVPFNLDTLSVNEYFHYGYIPEPRTAISGVRKLPAGHTLSLDVVSWEIEECCYWRMDDVDPLEGNPSNLIREELETISEIIIRSDVPIGVALSGGLDSSAITALAERRYPGAIQAFSVGYANQPRNDERADARRLAEYLKIQFHEIELRTQDFVEFFPELVYWQDDPIADIAGYGYYSVMKLAREHNVPVILQGHGGDELFWGYGWSRRAVKESQRKAEQWNQNGVSFPDYLRLELPENFTRMGVFRWVQSVAGFRSSINSYLRDMRNLPEQLVFYDLVPDYALAQRNICSFYTQSFKDEINGSNPAAVFTMKRPWPQLDLLITRLLCQTYLLENGVAQGDRLSMASSVELRLPLLDYKLVEIVAGLRKSERDYDLPPKAWLKAALKDVLPDWVVNRPKRGFTPPVREWHKALFKAYGDDLIDGELVRAGVLSHKGARQLSMGAFPIGVTAPLSFKALVLETWCRDFAV